ncbi:unnamed protein product [Effrenium voratum]|uniref:Uncharacterized protein n=1 Tax=Effrenium voratum TaxID=2562239 RepID=A0AA36NL38_9DINO|nr:unnamed protein product [Effrenium voratum]
MEASEPDDSSDFKLALTLLSIAVLTFLSQTFTGLNIGLMSLDTAQLKVLIDVPNKDEAAMEAARYARKILPLRQKGNLLLCTILLGNTAVNAAMAQLMADYAGGLVGFLLTTAIIVILCEIVPQSVCTRHGLFLGAAGSPIIRVAMILFYPITKPYALVLDRLFPQRENMLDRSQLQALVEYQKSAAPGMLAEGQAEMLIGALGMAQKTVSEVMVQLERACSLSPEDVLDYAYVAQVIQKGFSRFPVVDKTGQVVGLLHCKDLLSLREPEHDHLEEIRGRSATVGELLAALKEAGRERQVFVCGKNTTLMALLAEFKRRPHLAVVADSEEPGEAPDAKHVGIVTLHNIFGTILQAQVGFSEDSGAAASPRRHQQAGALHLFDRHRLESMAASSEQLGEDEAGAVMSFLVATLPKIFSQQHIDSAAITALLRETRPRYIPKRTELYRAGQETTVVTLVLQGAFHLTSGADSCESTCGPWACLGLSLLSKSEKYTSDFTAVALTDAFVLQIEQQKYFAACKTGPAIWTSWPDTRKFSRATPDFQWPCRSNLGTNERPAPCFVSRMARLLRVPVAQAFVGHQWRAFLPLASSGARVSGDLDLAGLAEGGDEAWARFEQQAVAGCGAWQGREIVQVLHACARAGRRPRRLLEQLGKDIPEKLPQLETSALCVCLHTFAQLRSRDTALFKVITRYLLREERAPELTAAHVASLLYSHVRMLHSEKGLLRLAHLRLSEDAWGVSDLATALQALATLRADNVRLSTASARVVAREAPQAPLPLLGDLLEASLRLSIPCRVLQQGLMTRCQERPEELADLPVEVLVKLLSCLGGVESADDACQVLVAQLSGRVPELDHPRRLVQAMDALAKVQVFQEDLLKSIGRQIAIHMVDFSPKDVASCASACQRLLVQDGAVLEAMARQGLRSGRRFKLPYVQAVVRACRTAGFEHPVVVELLEGMQQQQRAREERESQEKPSAKVDWESLEEEPMFDKPVLGEAPAVEPAAGPKMSPMEALHDGHSWRRERRPVEDPDARSAAMLEDKDIRRIMADVERRVLRPAGLKSRALEGRRNRK